MSFGYERMILGICEDINITTLSILVQALKPVTYFGDELIDELMRLNKVTDFNSLTLKSYVKRTPIFKRRFQPVPVTPFFYSCLKCTAFIRI